MNFLILELCTDYLISMHVQYNIHHIRVSKHFYYGVLLHNELLQCNFCDISSPHNAMHSSSIIYKYTLHLLYKQVGSCLAMLAKC